ncbi:MAG TPA: (deoxy)nucleoside triphosphate pyrophosphohydrolase [Dongiaceae bacterium]|nr:(deoxy)nucleoside triphosphate pyrophosphohydrolase [Dongiaceae bacterium]
MTIHIVAAVIERSDRRILIGQRRRDDTSPLKWEFPGGKVESGETPEQALARELREELDVTMLQSVPISRVEQAYGGMAEPLVIIFFAASIRETELHPGPFEQVLWVLPRELGGFDFLAANRRLVAELATGRIKPAEVLSAAAGTAAPGPAGPLPSKPGKPKDH